MYQYFYIINLKKVFTNLLINHVNVLINQTVKLNKLLSSLHNYVYNDNQRGCAICI
jgi:hypothetical protein